MRFRLPAAACLAVFLVTVATGRPPQDSKDPKEPPKGPTKLPELRWPTELGGKDLAGWLKDVTDPDPAVREFALRTLPNFGPENVRKPAGKLLLTRMSAEKDPGVRITVFNTAAMIGFETVADEKEAIRILADTASTGYPGGLSRMHAVQTLGLIGPKAEGAVPYLVGPPCLDPAYETRRSVANTLGRIGYSETAGPNTKALGALANTLAKDVSAAVRMEALQSLVVLGPPWAGPVPPGGKVAPKINWEGGKVVTEAMRARLGLGKSKPVETDRQIEIWCRVVLMRFDEKEITDENLKAVSRHLDPKGEIGVKLQALQALTLFGEMAGSQADAVVRVIDDPDALVVNQALTTLATMGVKAQGAIPELEKLEKKWADLRDKRLKEPDVQKAVLNLKPEEKERAVASLTEEQTRKAIANTIKWLKDSKPGMPGGPPPESKKM
jgi:hypothetical protein